MMPFHCSLIHFYPALEGVYKIRSAGLCARIAYKGTKIFRNINQYCEKFWCLYRRFIAAKQSDHIL
jgi:hypothetical protein